MHSPTANFSVLAENKDTADATLSFSAGTQASFHLTLTVAFQARSVTSVFQKIMELLQREVVTQSKGKVRI